MAWPTATASRRSASGWTRSATTSRSSPGCSRPGRATYEGEHAHVASAINVPKGIQQPRIPIIVGGNGEQRTAGYAIRFADELNFVFLDAGRDRRADGRRPATLRGGGPRPGHPARSRCTSATRMSASRARRGSTCSAGFAEIGLDRLVALPDPLVADRPRPRPASPRTVRAAGHRARRSGRGRRQRLTGAAREAPDPARAARSGTRRGRRAARPAPGRSGASRSAAPRPAASELGVGRVREQPRLVGGRGSGGRRRAGRGRPGRRRPA